MLAKCDGKFLRGAFGRALLRDIVHLRVDDTRKTRDNCLSSAPLMLYPYTENRRDEGVHRTDKQP